MNTSDASPLITTIIPTYRRSKLLRRAIVSALAQEKVPLVVRVFDNASGDETREMVEGLAVADPRLRYYCHDRNLGPAANFDFGLRSIDTPFFSILSDDDYLLPGFYERALACLAEHPTAMFWAGLTLNVDEKGTIWDARMERWPREGMFEPPEGMMAMTGRTAPTWTGIVFRREVVQQAGFPDPETLGPSDLDYCLRLGSRFSYFVDKYPSAVFTLNSASFSALQPFSSFWPGWIKMFHNLAESGSLTAHDRERVLGALHADARRMLFRRGANALVAGRYDYARDAAETLAAYYGKNLHAAILSALAFGCERIPGVRVLLSHFYRSTEAQIVRSRRELQRRYGSLLRHT